MKRSSNDDDDDSDDDDDYTICSPLADAFNALSVQEREEALEELHGVAGVLQESPALICQALQDLEVAIAKIKRKQSSSAAVVAYKRALFLNGQYVQNDEFRLKFIRCKRYDIEKAARRLLKHFEVKRNLFGDNYLAKDVTFDDLDPDSAELYLSASQWLLNRNHQDRSGRRIFLVTSELRG